MPNQPDSPQDSSPIPFRSHTALLLATALPFLQLPYRHTVELLLKFLEFSETIKLYREFHMSQASPFSPSQDQPKEAGLFGLINTFILDLEGLLNSLSQVCTGDEKEVVGMFLNIIRAKNFYDTYGDVLKSFMGSAANGDGDASPLQSMFGNLFSGMDSPFSGTQTPPPAAAPEESSNTSGASYASETSNTSGAASPFPGDISSLLNDEQKETLDLLKSLFSTD